MLKNSLVLITGGAGFIGSHTADFLAAKGYQIRILDSLKKPIHNGRWPKYSKNKGYELLKGDVRDKKAWLKALPGADYVFHLAAHQDQLPNFSKFFSVNTAGTALLYEAAVELNLPIKKVTLASSQFVYGDGFYVCPHSGKKFFPELRSLKVLKDKKWDILCPHKSPGRPLPFYEDQLVHPTNSYGLSKAALESIGLTLGKTYNIPTAILRYSIVQGPRQSPRNLYSGALRIFATQALKGEPITVYEDGLQKRDFVNIEDAVRANFLVLKNPKTNWEIFNVGGGRGYKVIDFAKTVKKITNSPSKIIIGGFRRTDTRHAVSSVSKLKKLGWRPRRTPEKSIKDYLDWLKNR